MGDFFFEWTEWLRNTFLLDWAFWMQETGISRVMVENFWGVPLAQVMHILSIALGFGATLMLTLRINDLAGGTRTVPQVSARYLPWIWWALVFIAVSGVLMLFAEPVRNMINAIFWFKMISLALLLAVTIIFQRGVRAQAHAGGPQWRANALVRTTSWVVVVLWCLVMVGGRWIAYAPV
ncbi:hypothetical protein GRI62_08690 [Erythrobacter arachoides]|uniref:DUF6644 domain-containing protein n=1 Tax=Aurantiacibacter arachoides TaxID=1850444 RepID=A0A845A2M3_9SPHN|nr:DUF6644 family protein [Aurantiacibacter arachoides]MXO93682.1 hypothetical protein [Aurantiacibacter arachoides]GGD47458.1 hypothetical protein GCM10011411_04000 [Aurantiacibacter arachoides]